MPVDLLLLDIVVILLAARLLGWLARKVGQPGVIGEIVAGVLLGPTLLGHFGGDRLFPEAVMPALEALADIGLMLFMFVVGLELDQKLIRNKAKVALSVAGGSIAVPFGLGALLAWFLLEPLDVHDPVAFVMFTAAAVSVTALPVLARILTDRGMEQTETGGLALASGAVVDVFVWIAFAVIVALSGSGEAGQWHTLVVVPYVVLMIVVVRPLLRRLVPAFQRAGRLTPALLAVVLLVLVASSWATEWMHIHFIFGAFIFGAVMPREGAEALTHEILERLEQVSVLLLMPMFFVVSGLSVDLTALDAGDFGILGLILLVAIGSKLVGTYVPARLVGVRARQATLLATLMNARGLTALVILNVGLQKALIDERMFSMMVTMAVVTTALSGWLQRWVYSDRRVARDIADAERALLGEHAAYRSLALVPSIAGDAGLARIAAGLTTGARPAEVVLGHMRPYPRTELEVGTGLSAELADMAGAMGQLEMLARDVGGAEVPARVVSRFAKDAAAELPGFVVAADPDVVVAASDLPGVDGLRGNGELRLVIAVAGRPDGDRSGVAVTYAGGAAADVTAELALRLARAGGEPLTVVGGRRAESLATRLSRLGMDVEHRGTPPAGALLVTQDGAADAANAHLLVRVEREPQDVDWTAVG